MTGMSGGVKFSVQKQSVFVRFIRFLPKAGKIQLLKLIHIN
jgi:hypothetical protein